MFKNRIVSAKELTLMGVVWIGAVIAALVMALAFAPKAHAAADKHVVLKTETWSMIRMYAAPNTVGTGTHVESYSDIVTTTYLFWPDGNSVNKIAITGFEVCYHRNAGNGALFQGVSANPFYADNNDIVNPGQLDADDDGTANNCNNYGIPLDQRVWFRMDQDPGWEVLGKIRIKFMNDDDFDFKWGGNTTRYFTPGDDPDLGDWFYCDCDYGGSRH